MSAIAGAVELGVGYCQQVNNKNVMKYAFHCIIAKTHRPSSEIKWVALWAMAQLGLHIWFRCMQTITVYSSGIYTRLPNNCW